MSPIVTDKFSHKLALDKNTCIFVCFVFFRSIPVESMCIYLYIISGLGGGICPRSTLEL